MIGFAADENFDNDIIRAVRRRAPEVDIVRVRDAGLAGASDPEVLAWAANEGRALLTHDVSTMIRHARERVQRNEPMPGLFVVRQQLPVGAAIDDLMLIAECSLPEEWAGQIRYLPLR